MVELNLLFSENGLPIGSSMEDLGSHKMSAVGTTYGDTKTGVRYFHSDGYISKLGLDKNKEIIGYEYVNVGKMMTLIEGGIDPSDALLKSTGKYGRFDEAVEVINPRKE